MRFTVEHCIYRGKTFEVEFYVSQGNKMPGYEYYKQLDEAAQRRFFVIVGHFADAPFGTIFPKTIYNIEDKDHGIYALKPLSHRFFCFTTSKRKLIVTNGYRKHSQKMTKKDKSFLDATNRMKQDYEDRITRGLYYE